MARDAEYAAKVRERARLAMKARRDADPEMIRRREREYMRARRAANPELMHRARVHIRDRRLRESAAFLVRGALSRSKKRGIECDLTVEWAQQRWTGKCELTGIEFRPAIGRQTPFSPSIDRIDPAKGYTQANCRFILGAVNYLKANGTDEDMFHIAAELIARRLRSQT